MNAEVESKFAPSVVKQALKSIIPDDDLDGLLSQIVLRQASDSASQLFSQIGNEVTRKIEAQFKRKAKSLKISVYLTAEEQSLLIDKWPAYRLDFRDSSPHCHGFAAALTHIVYHHLIELTGYHIEATCAHPYYIKDVGAKMHLWLNHPRVHCCNPMLSVKDGTRLTAAFDMADRQSVNMNVPRFCRFPAQNCGAKARYLLFVHSVYDMSTTDIADAMFAANSDKAYGCFIFVPEILVSLKGHIDHINMWWDIDINKDRITFSFRDGTHDYVHSFSKYREFVSKSFFSTSSKTAHYAKEHCANIFGYQLFTVSRTFCPNDDEMISVTIGSFSDTVIVSSFIFEENESLPFFKGRFPNRRCNNWLGGDRGLGRLVRIFALYDRQFYDRCYAHAYGLGETSFTIRNIFNYIKSSSARMVVNGQVVIRGREMRPDELCTMAVAIYVNVFSHRFCVTQAVKIVTDAMKVGREKRNRGLIRQYFDALIDFLCPAGKLLNKHVELDESSCKYIHSVIRSETVISFCDFIKKSNDPFVFLSKGYVEDSVCAYVDDEAQDHVVARIVPDENPQITPSAPDFDVQSVISMDATIPIMGDGDCAYNSIAIALGIPYSAKQLRHDICVDGKGSLNEEEIMKGWGSTVEMWRVCTWYNVSIEVVGNMWLNAHDSAIQVKDKIHYANSHFDVTLHVGSRTFSIGSLEDRDPVFPDTFAGKFKCLAPSPFSSPSEASRLGFIDVLIDYGLDKILCYTSGFYHCASDTFDVYYEVLREFKNVKKNFILLILPMSRLMASKVSKYDVDGLRIAEVNDELTRLIPHLELNGNLIIELPWTPHNLLSRLLSVMTNVFHHVSVCYTAPDLFVTPKFYVVCRRYRGDFDPKCLATNLYVDYSSPIDSLYQKWIASGVRAAKVISKYVPSVLFKPPSGDDKVVHEVAPPEEPSVVEKISEILFPRPESIAPPAAVVPLFEYSTPSIDFYKKHPDIFDSHAPQALAMAASQLQKMGQKPVIYNRLPTDEDHHCIFSFNPFLSESKTTRFSTSFSDEHSSLCVVSYDPNNLKDHDLENLRSSIIIRLLEKYDASHKVVNASVVGSDKSVIVVNAANSDLRRGAGVCGAVFGAAGPALDTECAALPPVVPGQAVITSGHNCSDEIIHAVAPKGTDTDVETKLESAYAAVNELAAGRPYRVPLLGAGIYGCSPQLSASLAARAAMSSQGVVCTGGPAVADSKINHLLVAISILNELLYPQPPLKRINASEDLRVIRAGFDITSAPKKPRNHMAAKLALLSSRAGIKKIINFGCAPGYFMNFNKDMFNIHFTDGDSALLPDIKPDLTTASLATLDITQLPDGYWISDIARKGTSVVYDQKAHNAHLLADLHALFIKSSVTQMAVKGFIDGDYVYLRHLVDVVLVDSKHPSCESILFFDKSNPGSFDSSKWKNLQRDALKSYRRGGALDLDDMSDTSSEDSFVSAVDSLEELIPRSITWRKGKAYLKFTHGNGERFIDCQQLKTLKQECIEKFPKIPHPSCKFSKVKKFFKMSCDLQPFRVWFEMMATLDKCFVESIIDKYVFVEKEPNGYDPDPCLSAVSVTAKKRLKRMFCPSKVPRTVVTTPFTNYVLYNDTSSRPQPEILVDDRVDDDVPPFVVLPILSSDIDKLITKPIIASTDSTSLDEDAVALAPITPSECPYDLLVAQNSDLAFTPKTGNIPIENAVYEQIEIWRINATNVRRLLTNYITERTQPSLAASDDFRARYASYGIVRNNYFVVRPRNPKLKDDASPDYMAGLTADGQFVLTTTPDVDIYVNDSCDVLPEPFLYEKYKDYVPKFNQSFNPSLTRGVPGCGKTHWIVNSCASGDLCLSTTKMGSHEIAERLKSASKRNVKTMTIDSYLLNSGAIFKNVYVDEAFMRHVGSVMLVGSLSQCENLYCLGDPLQIPYIERCAVLSTKLKYQSIDLNVSHDLSVSYRCPVDVAKAFAPRYRQLGSNFTSESKYDNTMKIHRISGVLQVPKHNVQYLTFTQNDKMQLMSKGYSRVSTVHEYQGQQADVVYLVRLTTSVAVEVFKSAPHILVALTRHKKELHYYTVVEGDAISAIINPYSGGGSVTVPLESGFVDEIPYYNPEITEIVGKFGAVTGQNEVVKIFDVRELNVPLLDHDVLEVEPNSHILQDANDALMGIGGYEDTSFDDYKITNSALDLPVASGSLVYERSVKQSPYGKLQPVIRTNCYVPRRRVLVESLLAIAKRNLNVPDMTGNNPDDILPSSLRDVFVSTYLLQRLPFSEIQISPSTIKSWLIDQPAKVVDAVLAVMTSFKDVKINEYDFSIKPTPKPCVTPDANDTIPALQTIAAASKIMNILFCPIAKLVKERLLTSLRNNVILNTDVSPSDFANILTDKLPPHKFVGKQSIEVDISKYDKSQGLLALDFEILMMKFFGVPAWMLHIWRYAHVSTRLIDRGNKMTARIELQRKSGDAFTLLGNTMLSMAVCAFCFPLKTALLCAFIGDDSWLVGTDIYRPVSDLFSRMFNLECKVLRLNYPMFCSKFLLSHDDRWYFVPDPLRMLVKFGRKDLANWEHLEECRVSFLDLTSDYDHWFLYEPLERAIYERYGVYYSMSMLLPQIRVFLSSFKHFSSLFVAPEDLPLCDDPSRSSLDM
ncbi:RdRp [Sanxia atyid shrimp virus 1]|uniref:RdRp n=1 Tax=Sanxia atyid shrimp virus 1 TaxID=1923355 RepID=UPI00090BE09F|nr:RdRp [Sanxia atyid shrimp virus 1]APG77735.1 RdRp [Sanxia atyid shrimp virus 1]